MFRSATQCKALSLVEMMIVLAVLSILAAIVVPRLSSAGDDARHTSVRAQLIVLRQQLEIWKLQHGGEYPTLMQMQAGPADWAIFTGPTRTDGAPDGAGSCGPYFTDPPVNPFTGSSHVIGPASLAFAGWVYDERSGAIRIIVPRNVDLESTDLGPADYVRR